VSAEIVLGKWTIRDDEIGDVVVTLTEVPSETVPTDGLGTGHGTAECSGYATGLSVGYGTGDGSGYGYADDGAE